MTQRIVVVAVRAALDGVAVEPDVARWPREVIRRGRELTARARAFQSQRDLPAANWLLLEVEAIRVRRAVRCIGVGVG